MIKIFVLSCLFFQLGCAAALVPESNDPKLKINQATDLFNNQGRPVGAVTLLKQAIPLAQQQNDKNSEAVAEFYLGEIYKLPGPRGEALLDPKEAPGHYDSSIKIYDEMKFFKNAAFVSWCASGAQDLLQNKKGSCDYLKAAKKLSEKSGADPLDKLPSIYANGKLFEMIQYQIKKQNCK